MGTREMPWVELRERQPANFFWIFVAGEPDEGLMEQMAQATFEQGFLDWAIVPLWRPMSHRKLEAMRTVS